MRELHQGDRPSDELIARCIAGHATPADEARVRAWATSPESEIEYQRVERMLELSARLPETLALGAPPTAQRVIDRIAARRLDSPGDVARADRSRASGRRRRGHWPLAAAAILALALPITFLVGRAFRASDAGFAAESFMTGPSETATITLRDGTVVRLAPSSRLHLQPSRTERSVSLDGRGYFAVAHQKGAPFVVRTRTGEIRVLGTRFDLAARDDDLQLVVVEGRVAVAARGFEAEVHRGQVSRVVKGMPVPVVEVPDTHELTAWVGKFLAFQSTPLSDAVLEISRHYDTRIEITDPALAQRTITAWFADWALEDVMMVVCTVAEARCRHAEDVITVEPIQRRSAAR